MRDPSTGCDPEYRLSPASRSGHAPEAETRSETVAAVASKLSRRNFLTTASRIAVLPVAAGLLPLIGEGAMAADADENFSYSWLVDTARKLAKSDYSEGEFVDKHYLDLTYDQYREIRVPETARIWRDENLGYELDLLPAGLFFKHPVSVYIVDDGKAAQVKPAADSFTFGRDVTPAPDVPLPFSGFRVRSRINSPDVLDEFIVFQGASYFRAVAKGQNYGLSSRGLANRTADPEGEEFPVFTSFWVEKPDPAKPLLVHALLDSPSATGAFRFTIRPGKETMVDVEATVFARVDLDKLGLAPLTSMFLFDGTNRERFSDYRNAVHDSDGLQILSGDGEWIWRPLANPLTLQVSGFEGQAPRGFGLVQRERGFDGYLDLESHFETRPSVWIEPIGDWIDGHVELVEIPTEYETNDNIVAFWRPYQDVPAGQSISVSYRQHWGTGPEMPGDIMTVRSTRIGRSFDEKRVLFVVDFAEWHEASDQLEFSVTGSAGVVSNAVLQPYPELSGVRASFEFDPEDAPLSEFRMQIKRAGVPVSETWLYRWTAQN